MHAAPTSDILNWAETYIWDLSPFAFIIPMAAFKRENAIELLMIDCFFGGTRVVAKSGPKSRVFDLQSSVLLEELMRCVKFYKHAFVLV